jgi:hypothetical protein
VVAVVSIERSEVIKDKPYIEILSPRAKEVWTEGDKTEDMQICFYNVSDDQVLSVCRFTIQGAKGKD